MSSDSESVHRLQRLVDGSFVSIGSRAVRAGLGFGSSVLLARGLGPYQFGLFTTGLLVARTLSIAAPMGMGSAISRFAAGGDAEEESIARLAATLGSISAVVLGLGLFLFAEPIAVNGFGQSDLAAVLRAGGIASTLLGLLRVMASLSRFQFAAGPAAIGQELIPSVMAVIAGVLSLVIEINALMAILLLASGFAVGAAYLARATDSQLWFPPLIKWPSVLPLLAFGLPAAASASLSFLVYRVDRLALAAISLPGDVGVYAAASQVALIPSMVMSAVNSVLSPLLGAAHRDGSRVEQRSLYKTARVGMLLVCMPFLILMLGAPSAVLSVLFGESYSRGGYALTVLACGQLVNILVGSVGTLHMMSGRERRWVSLVALANVIVAALCIALVPRLGLLGASAASAIGIATLNLAGFLFLRHDRLIVALPWRWRIVGGGIVGISILLMAVGENLRRLSLWFLLAASMTAIASTVAAGFWAPDEEERRALRLAVSRLKKLRRR